MMQNLARRTARSALNICLYIYIFLCIIYQLFKALRAVRRARFCIIFDTLYVSGVSFGVTFAIFVVIWGALWLHFLHQDIDWRAKAAPGGAKGGNAKIKAPFWTQF